MFVRIYALIFLLRKKHHKYIHASKQAIHMVIKTYAYHHNIICLFTLANTAETWKKIKGTDNFLNYSYLTLGH